MIDNWLRERKKQYKLEREQNSVPGGILPYLFDLSSYHYYALSSGKRTKNQNFWKCILCWFMGTYHDRHSGKKKTAHRWLLEIQPQTFINTPSVLSAKKFWLFLQWSPDKTRAHVAYPRLTLSWVPWIATSWLYNLELVESGVEEVLLSTLEESWPMPHHHL